ncbi:MAG: hypothetical protein HXY19_02005 [Thermoanaerobaculaceae bacterium]|nr:hypothetical protein [Thermoanaerobaculaceae bacterium]
MATNLIPALDPAPLPGPTWLFHLLWVVTFTIHLLFVNSVLGGTVLAALLGTNQAVHRASAKLFVEVNSWAISFAITFGIAPLLFLQVLFGRFFYTATILVAWWWLGLLGLLTVGYYLNYVAKFRLRAGKGAGAVLVVEAVCFLAVAMIQVLVNLLHLQPERWERVADATWAAFADPTFVPRYLHFLLAAVALAGAILAWAAVRRAERGGDQQEARGMAGIGIRAALVATILQLVDGFWLLFALPEGVLKAYMRSGAASMVPLALGILAGVVLLTVLAGISDPLAQGTRVRRAAELIVGAMLVMVVTRHQLRELYLATARANEQLVIAPQWGIVVTFLLVFVLGVAVTVFALVRAAKDTPAPGETAA